MARKVGRAFIDSRARLSFTSFSFVYRLVQRANAHWRVTAATKTSKAAAQPAANTTVPAQRRKQREQQTVVAVVAWLQFVLFSAVVAAAAAVMLATCCCCRCCCCVLTCCCFCCCFCGVVAGRNAFSGAAAAFCLRLCFFWRVSKLRRPRANLRKWEQRCQTVRKLFGGIKAKLVRKKINERLRAWSMAYWYLRYAEFDKFQISYKLTI